MKFVTKDSSIVGELIVDTTTSMHRVPVGPSRDVLDLQSAMEADVLRGVV